MTAKKGEYQPSLAPSTSQSTAARQPTTYLHTAMPCDYSLHRHGVARYENGGVYVGDWASDHRHGWGRHAFASGDAYEGEWADDRITGARCTGMLHQSGRDEAATAAPPAGVVLP